MCDLRQIWDSGVVQAVVTGLHPRKTSVHIYDKNGVTKVAARRFEIFIFLWQEHYSSLIHLNLICEKLFSSNWRHLRIKSTSQMASFISSNISATS